MAKRASNRERVQRKAVEAELTASEKAKKTTKAKKTSKAAKTSKSDKTAAKPTRRTKSPAISGTGLKMVWQVLDPNSKTVATFAYPEKDGAEAKAEQLAEKNGKEYRVRGTKVPLDARV